MLNDVQSQQICSNFLSSIWKIHWIRNQFIFHFSFFLLGQFNISFFLFSVSVNCKMLLLKANNKWLTTEDNRGAGQKKAQITRFIWYQFSNLWDCGLKSCHNDWKLQSFYNYSSNVKALKGALYRTERFLRNFIFVLKLLSNLEIFRKILHACMWYLK